MYMNIEVNGKYIYIMEVNYNAYIVHTLIV